MELNLKKPLVFFDLETTGLNITSDKIVEISYIKVFPNGTEESKTLRVNPGMHIPEQATAVHHITDDDVKDCPTFKQVARSLASVFEGCGRLQQQPLRHSHASGGISERWRGFRFLEAQVC